MLALSSTDTPYHLYKATFRNILEEISINDSPGVPGVPYYECPGHSEFFHRYVSKEKGKRKAAEYIKDIFDPNRNIKHAHYEIISQKKSLWKNVRHFNSLNRIYNHAIKIFYEQKDNNLACPSHLFHDSHNIK